jgi:hypothetical protein
MTRSRMSASVASTIAVLCCLAPAGLCPGETSTLQLEEPLGAQGAVSLLIQPPETYRNGPDAESLSVNLLEIAGVAMLKFSQSLSNCALVWQWDKDTVKDVLSIKTLLPELPGAEWYHLLYTWDAERGLFCGYLNGVALRSPETVVDAWSMTPRDQVAIAPGPWEIKGLTFGPSYLLPEEARAGVPEELLDVRADLTGAFGEREAIDVNERLGALLYETSLADAESIPGWVLEGPGVLEHADGWMKMYSTRPNGPDGHVVHWAPDDFPNRFVAEWEVQILSEDGLCIIFFSAMGNNGEDIFDPSLPKREGIFKQYNRGAIRCYHISYFANNPILLPGRVTSNLRKNPGAILVANGPVGIHAGSKEIHKVRLVRDGERMQLLVDGRVVIDWVDDGKRYGAVHGGGKIGLRQMQWTVARYRNLRVWELEAP